VRHPGEAAQQPQALAGARAQLGGQLIQGRRRPVGVLRLLHLVPPQAQHGAKHVAGIVVVLDDEDAARGGRAAGHCCPGRG